MINLEEAILAKIQEIDKIRSEIRSRAEYKAETIGIYEKKLAITAIQLKNGIEFIVDGFKVKDPPATYLKDIAKGICEKEKIEMEKADVLYKSLLVNLEAVQSQLNGYQSLNRYRDSI